MSTQDTVIQAGEILLGKVTRPYISNGQLLGAVLSFEGKSETALLHVKQVAGENPSDRLSNMNLGDEIRVKLSVTTDASGRKLRASERDLMTEQNIVDELNARASTDVYAAKVCNLATYGVFIELTEGVGRGKKGLVHNKNMFGGTGMSLKSFGELTPGKEVFVQILGDARVDERGTLRIDLAFAPKPEVLLAAS